MANDVLIAIVEDEENIRNLLSYNLQAAGFATKEFETAENALACILRDPPDLVLLDLMLPGMDGITACRRIRESEKARNTPVIILTARGEEFDRVLGLEIGADDYITKPFSMREVLARIRAVLRRSGSRDGKAQDGMLRVADLTIDTGRRKVFKGGAEIVLTMKEFDLLNCLAENRGKVITREQLLDNVWGYDFIGETRTVDVHVRHLRMKIESDPENPAIIESVRGVGYRLFED
jgi:two-component system alkaline phosphatase synthesis response regulator PhoP